jgi:hypothetical protein
LACALRYFAGGLPYDIMLKYGISHASLYEGIWTDVEAVNSCDEFSIEYPAYETAQLKIAHDLLMSAKKNLTTVQVPVTVY